MKNGRTSKVLTRVSVLLLAVCLLHLCGGVLCTWYIHSIEEERDALRALLWAQPTEEVLLRLERAIRRLAKMRSLKDTYAPKPATAYGVKKFSYLTALTFRKESVPVEECAGRIAARNAGVTPPCIPVVLAGEQITPQAAEALKKSKHVFGVADGKIEVIKIGGEK